MDLPSILPETNASTTTSQPHFSTSTHQKTICVIGAGPAGLGALKIVLDSDQYKAGTWIPVAFEAREEVGGIWFPALPNSADPPLTPLYDSLTTNIPHPVMAYGALSFPPETPLYPVAEKVHSYLKDFTLQFSLRPHIKFCTRVTSVTYTPTRPRRWLVQTSTDEAYYFDLIMTCNGHFHVPRYPSIPGLSLWQAANRISHSIYYRHPLPVYKDKTLLIVGSGPSGQDLVRDLNGYAAKVIFASSNFITSIDVSGVNLRPRLVSLGPPTTGTATFADGTVDEGIEYCILATGYMLDFPFLQPPLIMNSYPEPIPPLPEDLYNSSYSVFALAQQLWPLQALYPPESIAFLGLPVRVSPFPLIEAQARAVLRAFDTFEKGVESGDGRRGINMQAEVADIVARWEKLKARPEIGEGAVVKRWHLFQGEEQWDYRDHLSIFAEMDRDGSQRPSKQDLSISSQSIRVREWEKYAFSKNEILRRTWVKIEKSGEAQKWLKGVGKNGIDDWVDLMHRVVAYGEELEKDENTSAEAEL